jgi:hypothetical protein
VSTPARARADHVYLVLNPGVLSLGVLTDEDGVHVVVCGFVALDGHARADVREEVEGTAESEVEGDVALADCMWINNKS